MSKRAQKEEKLALFKPNYVKWSLLGTDEPRIMSNVAQNEEKRAQKDVESIIFIVRIE